MLVPGVPAQTIKLLTAVERYISLDAKFVTLLEA
jgi:hypothetical protein